MINADVEARHDVTVAVVREKGARFQIERASIDPPRPHDVIVRVVATGVCHTDMLVRDQDYPVPLPAVTPIYDWVRVPSVIGRSDLCFGRSIVWPATCSAKRQRCAMMLSLLV